MNKLKVIDFHGTEVIDSREVAVMVDKRHDHLVRDIKGYLGILEKGIPNFGGSDGARKIVPSDFFIPSTYISEQNKELPCFLITKKGCDMVANKLTGEKGILFTAAYVTAFEEMREKLTKPRLPPEVSPGGLAKLISITRRTILDAGGSPQDVCGMVQGIFQTWGIPVPKSLSKQIPGQMSWFDPLALQ